MHLWQASTTLASRYLSLISQAHQLGDCPSLNLSLTRVSRERQPTGHGFKLFSLRRIIIIIAMGYVSKTLLVVSMHCYVHLQSYCSTLFAISVVTIHNEYYDLCIYTLYLHYFPQRVVPYLVGFFRYVFFSYGFS